MKMDAATRQKLSLGVLAVLGILFVLDKTPGFREELEQKRAEREVKKYHSDMCDKALKSTVTYPDTFRIQQRFVKSNTEALTSIGYNWQAKNAFGVQLSGNAECTIEDGRLTSFSVNGQELL